MAKKTELHAIKIGERKVPTSLVLYNGDPTKETIIFYYFWYLNIDGKSILIDTGFKPEIAKERGVNNTRHPVDQLAKLKVNPNKIDVCICTHLHWDHAGGPAFFQIAKVFVPKKILNSLLVLGYSIQYSRTIFIRLAYAKLLI